MPHRTHPPSTKPGICSCGASLRVRMASKDFNDTASRGSAASELNGSRGNRRSTASTHSSQVVERVSYGDFELLGMAQETRSCIDFYKLMDLSGCAWKWKRSKREFSIFSRTVEGIPTVSRDEHEVLAAGEIRCSVQELGYLLRTESENEFNSAWKGMLKKEFIYGSIVHAVPFNLSTVHEDDEAAMSVTESVTPDQLTVKTAAFVGPGLLNKKNEQWCYLEYVKKQETGEGFTVTMKSLHETDVGVGKADPANVDQLHDLTIGLSVQQVPNSKTVCVLFHANFNGDNADIKGNASTSATKSRMMTMAKGVSRMSRIVRRRRLGAQTLADLKKFTVKNSNCICCTKSLGLFAKKKRCHLCGYFVCEKCCSDEGLETRNGNVTNMLVCTRCVEAVNCCNYTQVTPRQLGTPTIQPDASDSAAPGQSISEYLRTELKKAPLPAKSSLMNVIKHLVDTRDTLQDTETLRSSSSAMSPFASPAAVSEADEDEFVNMLDKYFTVDNIPVDECVLSSNVSSRSYPITFREDLEAEAPEYPMPENEAERLSIVDQDELATRADSPELNIVCNLAAQELGCMASLVTVITKENQYVLASNMENLRQQNWPRDQVFCAHTIMDTKPLVIPHPEADVRFHNAFPVTDFGVAFYCGFPIVGSDGTTVVGSVCCLDTKTHELTQSQYSSMQRLAKTASKIIETQGQAP